MDLLCWILVGKAKYMIRQVEPDWIHFEQLWDGGFR